METFNPKQQLSASDNERLAVIAGRLGMTVAEYIEYAIKKLIFTTPQPQQKGGTK